MAFCTKSKICINLNIEHDNTTIEEIEITRFPGLWIDSKLKLEKTH